MFRLQVLITIIIQVHSFDEKSDDSASQVWRLKLQNIVI
jgi:hypothetical protein